MALLFTQISITILSEVASTSHTLSVIALFPRVNSSSARRKEPGTRGEKRARTPSSLMRLPCPLSLPLTYLLCIPQAAGGDVPVDKTLLHENCLSVALWRDPLGAG